MSDARRIVPQSKRNHHQAGQHHTCRLAQSYNRAGGPHLCNRVFLSSGEEDDGLVDAHRRQEDKRPRP